MTIERLLEAGRALDAGRLDQAEQMYRQVADADPRSSIAVVGLARVAKERGDDRAAARLAEAALAVDPGNVAARRLLGEQNSVVPDAAAPDTAVQGGASNAGDVPATGSASDASAASTAPAASAGPVTSAEGSDAAGGDEDWPWPDLEQQLARYRGAEPGRLARLLKRG